MKIDAIEKSNLLQAVETLRSFIEHIEEKKGCISCRHWSGGSADGGKWTGGCLLAEGAMPPKDAIENGCESWVIFDEIPF